MRSDTGDEVVARRMEELNNYLQSVVGWIKQGKSFNYNQIVHCKNVLKNILKSHKKCLLLKEDYIFYTLAKVHNSDKFNLNFLN